MGNVISNEYSFLVEWGVPRWDLEKKMRGSIGVCSRRGEKKERKALERRVCK